MSDPAFDQEISREVGVLLARRKVEHAWADHVWSPEGVLVSAPDTPAGTLISDDGQRAIVFAGAASIDLFASDTTNYRDNMMDGTPRLWLAARLQDDAPVSVRVTADPTEGEAFFEAGYDIVGTVPMPDEIAAWIAAFTDAFHVERVFLKRQRDRSERKERGFGRKPGERGA
jgi:hypothetical protein